MGLGRLAPGSVGCPAPGLPATVAAFGPLDAEQLLALEEAAAEAAAAALRGRRPRKQQIGLTAEGELGPFSGGGDGDRGDDTEGDEDAEDSAGDDGVGFQDPMT